MEILQEAVSYKGNPIYLSHTTFFTYILSTPILFLEPFFWITCYSLCLITLFLLACQTSTPSDSAHYEKVSSTLGIKMVDIDSKNLENATLLLTGSQLADESVLASILIYSYAVIPYFRMPETLFLKA